MEQVNGMSLRDWFAGQAVSGALQGYDHDRHSLTRQRIAENAYAIADAMLKARAETKPVPRYAIDP